MGDRCHWLLGFESFGVFFYYMKFLWVLGPVVVEEDFFFFSFFSGEHIFSYIWQ